MSTGPGGASRERSDLRSARSYLGRFRWRRLLRLGPFRWRAAAPWRAARVAVGVVVPLAVGSAAGHLEYGAFASLGALPAGFASFQGVTRTRVAAVSAASVGMAVSTFVGATTAAAVPWLLVVVVSLWGYLVGLAVCLGPRLSVAAVQWPVALLISIGLPLGPAEAALRACLVLAGGLFQGALVALSWALQKGDPERAALSASFRSLAAYAAEVTTGRAGAPPSAALPGRARLADPNPLLPEAVRLAGIDLLEQAERIRAALSALSVHVAGDPSGSAGRFTAGAGRALGLTADALSSGRAERPGRLRELDRYLAELKAPSGAGAHWAAESLLGQLRACSRILGRLDAARGRTPSGDVPSGFPVPAPAGGLGWTVLTLRANLTPAGEAGRHAVRLAVVAGLAELMVQATGLFEGRWVVLTIFLVLKPDYNSTVYRSVHRAIGTAVGAGLGAAVAELAHPGPGGLVVAAGITVAAAYALFDVNYALYSCFLTVYIVVLLDILGFAAGTTATARLVDTAIGATLALVAFSLWPTWEGLTAQEKFARLMRANGRYAKALLHELAYPGQVRAERLRTLQAAARRARTDAEASTARLADEPAHPPLTPAVARALVAAVTRLAHAELSLHALIASPCPCPPVGREGGSTDLADDGAGRLDALGAALDVTMADLAGALRSMRPPGALPPLRRLQEEFRDQPVPPDVHLTPLTDDVVNAVDTLAAVLRRGPVAPAS
ncbi:FUSC family protein [Streptomyces sp. NPDC088354]|uniref:FUSC family protein n=1 Tax=Streptomyces sp. NPDC088354 TaxID=3365856 RepID=UPI0038143A28